METPWRVFHSVTQRGSRVLWVFLKWRALMFTPDFHENYLFILFLDLMDDLVKTRESPWGFFQEVPCFMGLLK